MVFPHTITVYNVERDTDTTTFEDTLSNHITVITGVYVYASNSAHATKDGLQNNDSVVIYVPFTAKATDIDGETIRNYVEPPVFSAAEDKSNIWTMTVDRGTFICKGIVFEPDKTQEEIAKNHNGVFSINRIDIRDYGSPRLQHWEIGGV